VSFVFTVYKCYTVGCPHVYLYLFRVSCCVFMNLSQGVLLCIYIPFTGCPPLFIYLLQSMSRLLFLNTFYRVDYCILINTGYRVSNCIYYLLQGVLLYLYPCNKVSFCIYEYIPVTVTVFSYTFTPVSITYSFHRLFSFSPTVQAGPLSTLRDILWRGGVGLTLNLIHRRDGNCEIFYQISFI